MTNRQPLPPRDGHTAASLADVLEKHYFPSDGLGGLGAQIYLSEHEWWMVIAALRSEVAQRAAVLKEGARLGAVAYAELLREIQNNIPRDVGTDRQSYDHVIKRMQDKHGSYQAQIAKAVDRALKGNADLQDVVVASGRSEGIPAPAESASRCVVATKDE